jgi:hypothetical protein
MAQVPHGHKWRRLDVMRRHVVTDPAGEQTMPDGSVRGFAREDIARVCAVYEENLTTEA